MIKISFGNLNSDDTKAVYLTNELGEKVFAFWYSPKHDNPERLKPTQAVERFLKKADYTLEEFFELKLSWKAEV